MSQNVAIRANGKENMKKTLRDLEDRSKSPNTCLNRSPKRTNDAEAIHKGVMAENFPRLERVLYFPDQEISLGMS